MKRSKGLFSKTRKISSRKKKKYYEEFKILKENDKVRIRRQISKKGGPNRKFENKIGIIKKKINLHSSKIEINFKKKKKILYLNNLHFDLIN